MKKIDISQLHKIAIGLNDAKKSWHFHLLAPVCEFNSSKSWKIILEKEKIGESYYSVLTHKPTKEAKVLESLFYKGK